MVVIPNLTESDIQRFWSKISVSDDTDICWNWLTKTVCKNGYGRMYLKDKINNKEYLIGAHRISFFIFTQIQPKDLLVCHRCDNPKCCNPNHLFLGDYLKNRTDCVNKKRQARGDTHGTKVKPESLAFGVRNGHYTHSEATPKGEAHSMAKLCEQDVLDIKKLYKKGGVSQQKIADFYGVNQVSISSIICNKSWKHLNNNLLCQK